MTIYYDISQTPDDLKDMSVVAFNAIFLSSERTLPKGMTLSSTSRQGLRQAIFKHGGKWVRVIEQNPITRSLFAQLTRERGYEIAWVMDDEGYVHLYNGGSLIVYRSPDSIAAVIGSSDDLRSLGSPSLSESRSVFNVPREE